MDELTKNFLEHYRATHPGMPIKYFDASEGIPISAFNPIEEPAFPPKTVYQDFPPQAKGQTTMSTIRDTHFQGFAQALYQELSALEGSHETVISDYRNKYDKQEIVTLIAQRAYDLAEHIYNIAPVSEYEWRMSDIPDLTSWPASKGQSDE